MIADQDLAKIRSILQAKFSFQQVILFGSQATGLARDGSDIDLCVVSDAGERKLDVSRRVRQALYTQVRAPLDVLVYSPAELATRARELKSIERAIVEEGIPLYG